MNKARFTSALAAVLLLLFTYACSQGQQSKENTPSEQNTQEESVVDAAASVNGVKIPMSELETAVRNVVMQNGMDPGHLDAFMDQFGPRILDQLIDGELLSQAAVKEGFKATDEEVDGAYEELAGRYASSEEFQAEMEKRGFTESSLKQNIGKQISIQKYIEGTIVPKADVPEDTVREAYDQNPQNFVRQEEVTASHILINSAESDPQEKKDEALKKAQEIAVKARAEGADFAELARTYSEGPSGPSGGALGSFTRGRMVKPFEEAAFSMKVGDVSDPVLTQFGYHIIKVTDHKDPNAVPFDQAKANIVAKLVNEKKNTTSQEYIQSLKDKATIVYPTEATTEPNQPATPAASDSATG